MVNLLLLIQQLLGDFVLSEQTQLVYKTEEKLSGDGNVYQITQRIAYIPYQILDNFTYQMGTLLATHDNQNASIEQS